MSLYSYKVQVPKTIPDDALTDNLGRKWIKASKSTTEKYLMWDTDEELWYVWFRRGLEVPEEGEVIELNANEYVVENVYRNRRLKRAMVSFSN